MRTHSEVIREVTLSPGEYNITRHDYGVDLIEVIGGELKGQAFPVWCSWQVSLSRAGNAAPSAAGQAAASALIPRGNWTVTTT